MLSVMSVPLPSKGIVYPVGSPLFKLEKIDVREMTANEEDLLTSLTLIRKGTAIDEVVKACLQTKNVDPVQLLVGDRNSLVTGLVLASYGSKYEADVKCESCGEMNKKYEFNVNNLPVKWLSEMPATEGVNEFSFTLPKSLKVVTFKLATTEDEKEITAVLAKLKSATNREANITTRFKRLILSIDGERDPSKIAEFIDRRLLPIADSLALRNHIMKISPDIDTSQPFTCAHCGFNGMIDMPIDFNFFWRA
jgi:hypothetical protein